MLHILHSKISHKGNNQHETNVNMPEHTFMSRSWISSTMTWDTPRSPLSSFLSKVPTTSHGDKTVSDQPHTYRQWRQNSLKLTSYIQAIVRQWRYNSLRSALHIQAREREQSLISLIHTGNWDKTISSQINLTHTGNGHRTISDQQR